MEREREMERETWMGMKACCNECGVGRVGRERWRDRQRHHDVDDD